MSSLWGKVGNPEGRALKILTEDLVGVKWKSRDRSQVSKNGGYTDKGESKRGGDGRGSAEAGEGSKQLHGNRCGVSLSLVMEGGRKEDLADDVTDCSVGPRLILPCQRFHSPGSYA